MFVRHSDKLNPHCTERLVCVYFGRLHLPLRLRLTLWSRILILKQTFAAATRRMYTSF